MSTQNKFSQLVQQAKDSLKVLEMLEKEAVAKAREFVKIPNGADRMKMTNDKILSSLKKLGLATREEVQTLEAKIEKLEHDLTLAKKSKSKEKDTTHTAEKSAHPSVN